MKIAVCERAFLFVVLFVALVIPATAQDTTFRLDVTAGDDTKSITAFSSEATPEVDRTFSVTVVLDDAVNLMGSNCDLEFDETQLEVVSIEESVGDVNFDGRVNIFDIRELGSRYGLTDADTDFSSYFDLDTSSPSVNKIDGDDLLVVAGDDEFNLSGIFVTSNDPTETSLRESIEIFESPAVSNQKGFIDDIVFVLLARPGVDRTEFSFTGDARIAEITFQAKEGFSGLTELSFISESLVAIDSDTTVTTTDIDGELQYPELTGESLTVNVKQP